MAQRRQTVLEKIRSGLTYFDGAMGTILQEAGLPLGELPERWNLTHPELIRGIHRRYLDAGADIIKTNTFGANGLKFSREELEAVITAGVSQARAATEECGRGYVALDIGPCGKLLKPYGDLEFERAVEIFAEAVRIGEKGADCILIETMNDSYETKAAVLAAKENSSLPVFVTNVYGMDGKLMTGADPEAMVALLEGLRVDALGLNCSLGVKQMLPLLPRFAACCSLPLIVNPNAGLPREENGKTVYDVDAEEFSELMKQVVACGARVIGGCCGTTPEFIGKTVEKTASLPVSPVTEKGLCVVSSYTQALRFGERTVLIGERINPTGKKRFKQALREHDVDYVLQEGIHQQEQGADVLDVNVGLPEIDEAETLCEIMQRLQGVCSLPLQLDSTDTEALSRGLRLYNGKAMINSVNGKQACMDAVFPLAQKYGGLVVALTIDEAGIPDTAEGRVRIAENIAAEAAKYGIGTNDLIFDPLCMAVSSGADAAAVTLKALRLLRERGYRSSLGVSNISFGLPARDTLNGTFFALAMENGLNAAIMNVYSAEMMQAYYAFNALRMRDENFTGYIEFATQRLPAVRAAAAPAAAPQAAKGDALPPLRRAVVKGLCEQAAALTGELLRTATPLEIIDGEIIPALDIVGKGYENKTMFLPQLLMSAEAAQAAFAVIKDYFAKSGAAREKRSTFVIATVKGDIHDIGKNIVKVLLENYGFDVIDLGKDVPPETVAEAVVRSHAPMAGLSALMTTTVPSMAETVVLLRERAPWCRIVVGGAVMTQEYADRIGADKYARDAMETVRYAEEVESLLKGQPDS